MDVFYTAGENNYLVVKPETLILPQSLFHIVVHRTLVVTWPLDRLG